MRPSYVFDPDLYQPGSIAAQGGCSHHAEGGHDAGACTDEAVVSFRDSHDAWQSGCSRALEELVTSGEIEPLGDKA